MYCSKCGNQNPDESLFCASCGARLVAASEVKKSAELALIGLIIIAGGAIMMLISMALDWYTVRDSIPSSNLDFSRLLTERYLNLNWAGTGLPLIFIIFFPAIVLISVLYSFFSNRLSKNLWVWLGSLCLASLAANFAYILFELLYRDIGYYVTPNAGWIVAFIGALAVILGSGFASRTVSQSNPIV